MVMYGQAVFNQVTFGIEVAPNVTVTNTTKDTVSDELGHQTCVVSFQADKNLMEWVARADGSDYLTGLIVGSGGSANQGDTIEFNVDFNELTSGDKVYRINVYARNTSGVWSEYGI